MAMVPVEPKYTASVPESAKIPDCRMIEPALPKQLLDCGASQQKAAKALVSISAQLDVMAQMQAQQHARIEDRCSSEQWLDENEREWYSLDEMLRSRPWAKNKDKPFPYPFREVTNQMRAAEGGWIGDDRDPPLNRKDTREDWAECEVLLHIRPTAEFPPSNRVILFMPEGGSESSFDSAAWSELTPFSTCDIWAVSWQGWIDFEEMLTQVALKILSFADAVSTVWFGHSMGALIAYEVLKCFEQHHTPNLPVALMVSGCPAPHLFQREYRPLDRHPFLSKLKSPRDFDRLTEEQIEILMREFQIVGQQPLKAHWMEEALKLAPGVLGVSDDLSGSKDALVLTEAQRMAFLADLKMMKSYRFTHENDKRQLCIPIIALCHDEDPLVEPESMQAWREYCGPGCNFECVALEDFEDTEELAAMGHGYTRLPTKHTLEKVTEVGEAYVLVKEVDEMLPDPGPLDNPLPKEVDCVVVGAGIAGITQGKALAETGRSVIVLDKYRTVGGIWMFYANNFSRVNSSEPAYRVVNQEGPGTRPNEDHSPRHDILRDIFTIASKCLYGKIRCNAEVVEVKKRADETWDVFVKDVRTGQQQTIHTKVVSFNVNRRIGKRRNVTFPGAKYFRGDEVYGYANEVLGLKFWGKRVIVVGAGAFAFENLRTAIEHGAKHVTVLGRRSGTTCPKWIDMIAFLRPLGFYWETNRNGNILSFDAWRKCYEDAGLMTPECWEEGLLKPHNHTVSVSDLAFIGGYHGMVDLKVGEIKCFRTDGQGVELKDGTKLDCDIVIKATGFHLNADVAQMTGYSKLHSFNLLDFNLNYGAEPLLDGGQFGNSTKGRVAVDVGSDEPDEAAVQEGMVVAANLQLPDLALRVNPFGSAYVGGMLTAAYFFKWLVEHPEYQKALLESAGQAVGTTTEQWASQSGTLQQISIKRFLVGLRP